jgi:hypothetical protein
MDFQGDKERTIYAMMVANMWKDPALKTSFISDPKAALAKEGITLGSDVAVKVVEDTPTVKYVNLPRDAGAAATQDQLGALMTKLIPIPEGTELRLVQSTESTRYVVIPNLPQGVDPAQSTQPKLMAMAADSGVEATYHDTSQSVEAESTEVTVTETTEVQDTETSTTVVAEAELVAT